MTQICTTVEQSKTLVELGIDVSTADMHYTFAEDFSMYILPMYILYADNEVDYCDGRLLPAWSLSALLDLLECPVLQKDKIGDGKEAWMVSCYPDGARVDSYWNESPIDACVKMIVKLKEK